jgi:hypothetical protein
MRDAAALAFAVLAAMVVLFQVTLAAGMPWGHLTLGGRFSGRLPWRIRPVAALSAILLAAFAVIVLVRAGLMLPAWMTLSRAYIWVVVAYCAVGTVAHLITPSRAERRLWLPVVAAMLACSLITALR